MHEESHSREILLKFYLFLLLEEQNRQKELAEVAEVVVGMGSRSSPTSAVSKQM